MEQLTFLQSKQQANVDQIESDKVEELVEESLSELRKENDNLNALLADKDRQLLLVSKMSKISQSGSLDEGDKIIFFFSFVLCFYVCMGACMYVLCLYVFICVFI